jgi:hypothetical protein
VSSYLITATFPSVIARHALTGSTWLDLFWPMFGAALIAGALLLGAAGLIAIARVPCGRGRMPDCGCY